MYNEFGFKLFKKKNFKPIVVVITADPRGDYIEAAIKKFGAESIRIDFNAFDVKEYKNLKELANKDNIIAIAMDGPLVCRQVDF